MSYWQQFVQVMHGTSHLSQNQPCNDRAKVLSVSGLALMIVVDGAGNSTSAGESATTILKAAEEELGIWAHHNGKELSEADVHTAAVQVGDFLNTAVKKIDQVVQEKIKLCGKNPDVYSSALGLSILGKHWVASVGVGDVACFSGQIDDWEMLGKIVKMGTSKRPHARNVTHLLPIAKGQPLVPPTIMELQPNDMTILCTDGALQAFARDQTPLNIRGQYAPISSKLNLFYEELAARAKLRKSTIRARSMSADNWLEVFLRKLAAEGSTDDISIAVTTDLKTY